MTTAADLLHRSLRETSRESLLDLHEMTRVAFRDRWAAMRFGRAYGMSWRRAWIDSLDSYPLGLSSNTEIDRGTPLRPARTALPMLVSQGLYPYVV